MYRFAVYVYGYKNITIEIGIGIGIGIGIAIAIGIGIGIGIGIDQTLNRRADHPPGRRPLWAGGRPLITGHCPRTLTPSVIRPILYFRPTCAGGMRTMPKLAANLTTLFTEQPFLDRFAAAGRAGFRYVEFLFPYDHPPGTLAALLREHRLNQVLFNFPPGDWAQGDRGLASDPRRIDEFRRSVDTALEYAVVLDADRIHCMAGVRIPEVPYGEQRRVLVENLRYACRRLGEEGILLLIEPLNSIDMPGYLYATSMEALTVIDEVGARNILLQYDVYHMQKMEGNLVETMGRIIHRIGHVQIADNPGRHQPGTGEIDFATVLRTLDELDYNGFVGLEYTPTAHTLDSLAWIREMGGDLHGSIDTERMHATGGPVNHPGH